MTPRELYIAGAANNEKQLEELTAKKHLIYTQAVLNRTMIWAKNKPPTYEKLFGQLDKREMNDDELYKQVVALNKEFGGIDKRGEMSGGS